MNTHRPRLSVESLESREVLASSITETFNSAITPALPADWHRWVSDGSTGFSTAPGLGLEGSNALVTDGTSRTAALAWSSKLVGGNDAVEVSVRADTLVPVFVFARGSNLATQTPTYLAAVVTRGLTVQLVEVNGGVTRVLGSITSPSSAYLSQQWVKVSLVPTGNSVAVRVTRDDTGQSLNASGGWQTAPTVAINATTTAAATAGYVGVGRAGAYSGQVRLDDFTITPAAPVTPPVVPGVANSFDSTAVNALPSGWQTWNAGAAGSFAVTSAIALSPSRGLASSGGSTTASRAWTTTDLPADVTAGAAVYVNSLIPAQVLVRGSNLNTAAPTYYAASITRGLTVEILRVVNGTQTVIGSVKSADYISNQWIRVRLTAEGDRLRANVYRTDTGEWLASDGSWGDTPDFALEVRDTAISAGGVAGVGRGARYSGTVTFDDFEALPAGASNGPTVAITHSGTGSTFTGDITFRAVVTGSPVRVEFRLDGVLREVTTGSSPAWTLDTSTLANGTHTLTVRAFDAEGNLGDSDFTFTASNSNAIPIPNPTIPRHYDHIRIAQLAYSGNPMGAFELNLLRNSVDLVVPNTRFLSTIDATSPDTPQLIYSNVSNLYLGLLTDWLAYADSKGVSRELAFYHVSKATAFTGSSPSSQPVNWFWGVSQTTSAGVTTDVTAAARGGRSFNVTFGGTGTTTAIGYTDKFREMNVSLVRGASAGWSGVWEYVSAVDATGKPTAWRTLSVGQDGTNGLKQNGTITFDPPANWIAASIGGGDRLFHVRFRVTAGTAGQGPELKTVFGRDYVGANGAQAGTIPAFDYAADKDGDGYLSDSEYAARKTGMNARFTYESRLFYPYYGQMRFVTNPSSPALRGWAADYHTRLLQANPLADGIFMDNALGKVPFSGIAVLEPTAAYGIDSGALMTAVSRAIAPNWIMANTAGGGADGNFVAAGSTAAFEEFALRPLQANWANVRDVANLVESRLASGTRYLVIDSHPAGGSPIDHRTQLATLAYYYLVADAERTFLMFFGGSNPSSTWNEHWTPAAAVDVGQPIDEMSVFATGADPANKALTYQVLERNYENGLVLYKPLSYTLGVGTGTTANNTATTHQLGGSYRKVNADGTLGPVITSLALRNGEGAVLIKA